MLHLVAAADQRFFPGLLTALATAVERSSGRIGYKVTVIDGGISEGQWALLDARLSTIAAGRGIDLELSRISKEALLLRLPERRGSSLSYARLAIPHVLEGDYFIYLDSDVICFRGIEEFRDAMNPGVYVTAARDPLGKVRRDKSMRNKVRFTQSFSPYFNAGIIGINAKLWREEQVSRRIEELLKEAHLYSFADQTLLNIVFKDRWTEVPHWGNHVLTIRRCSRIMDVPCLANLHFTGRIKPWLSEESSLARLVPDYLYDLAFRWASDSGDPTKRTVREETRGSILPKSKLERIMRPRRMKDHSILEAMENHPKEIARLLWDRFGFPGRIPA